MDTGKQGSKSLIMCVTPLQLLIAKKIIENNPKKDFFLIMFASNISENNLLKCKFYFDSIIDSVENHWYEEVSHKGFFSNIQTFFSIKKKFDNLKIKFDEYYLASIDSMLFQYFISKKNEHACVYTFDDGVANIFMDSIYYGGGEKFAKKLFLKFMGVKFFKKEIKEISIKHYTIYNDFDNIIKEKYYIDIFQKKKNVKNRMSNYIIFIGQPLNLLKGDMTYYEVEKICKKLGVDEYFPHPAEKFKLDTVFTVNSNYIFEDYISDRFAETDKNFLIYSFCSSAALSLLNNENIKVVFLKNEKLYEHYRKFYDLIEQKGGVVKDV